MKKVLISERSKSMKKVLISVLSTFAILTNVFAASAFAACPPEGYVELEKIGEWRMQMNKQEAGYRIENSTDKIASDIGVMWVGNDALPSQTEGITPSAMTLEGTKDAVVMDNSGSIIGGRTEFSISEWINVEQLLSDSGDFIHILDWDGQLRVALFGSGQIHVVAATDQVGWYAGGGTIIVDDAIETNKWQHIGITYDQTNGLNLYINGVLKGSQSNLRGALLKNTNNICVGGIHNKTAAVKRSFDDIVIYAKALTADQVRSIASAQPLYYLSGEKTADGKLLNKGFCDDVAPNTTKGTFNTANMGRLGKSISFTGNDADAALGKIGQGDFATRAAYTNQITLATWVKRNSGSQCLVDKDGAFRIVVGSDGKVSVVLSTDNVGWYGKVINSTQTIPENEWTHLAVTYDGSKTAIYINGGLDTENSEITGNINDVRNNFNYFEICNGSGAFEVDEFQLYGRALTAEEIKSMTKDAAVNVKSLCGSPITCAPCGSTVYAEATMNTAPTNDAILFLAVYDKSGVLKNVIAKKYEQPANANPENPMNINSDLLNIPKGLTENYGVVRAFLWDKDMTPID